MIGEAVRDKHEAIKCSGWVFYEDCLVEGEYNYADMLN